MKYIFDINQSPVFNNGRESLLLYLPLYSSFLKFPNNQKSINKIRETTSLLKTYNDYEASTTKKNVVFNITNKCNLACPYCWANSSVNSSAVMNPEEAISIAKDLCSNYDIHRIHFMGGEPTQNFITVKKVVNYIRDEFNMDPIYYITTNGVLDNTKLDWLIKNNFVFTVSIDTTNDEASDSRKSISGETHFRDSVLTIKELVKNNIHFRVRITVTKNNQHSLKKSVEELGKLGVKYLHIEKMSHDGRGTSYGANNDIGNSPFHDLFFSLINIAYRYDMGLMNSNLTNLYNPSNYFCNAIKSKTININTDGSVSHCYKATNNVNNINKEFVVGKFDKNNKQMEIDEKLSDFLSNINYTQYSQSENSPYLNYWSGGCPFKNFSYAQNWDKIDENAYDLSYMMLSSAIESIYNYSLKGKYSPLEGSLWFYERISDIKPGSYINNQRADVEKMFDNMDAEIIPLVKKGELQSTIESCDICI